MKYLESEEALSQFVKTAPTLPLYGSIRSSWR